MKKIDKDGLLLCELQAKTFELSQQYTDCSSDIFVRRFMNSKVAKSFDNKEVLQTNIQPKDVLNRIEEQYGLSMYGSVKYSANELFWMGYLYRYFSYTYDLSSVQVYKVVKPKELRSVFLPYHTMDTAQAIERILESKNLLRDDDSEMQRQFEIFKKIRQEEKD